MAVKKAIKVLGIFFISLFVIPICAATFLYFTISSEKITSFILPHIEKLVGRRVAVEKAHVAFFPQFGIKISNLTIENTQKPGFSSDPFVSFEEFMLKVKLFPLFQKKIEITKILLSKPSFLVETDSTGIFNFADLAFLHKDSSTQVEKKTEASSKPIALPIPLSLEEFVIQDGSIQYNNRFTKQKVTIGSVDYTLALSLDKNLQNVTAKGILSLNTISLYSKEIKKELTNRSLRFNHALAIDVLKGNCIISDTKLVFQKIGVAISGTIKNFNATPELAIDLTTDTVLISDLLKEIPEEMIPELAKLKAQGYLNLTLAVKGILDSTGEPSIRGTLRCGNGLIQYSDLPKNIHSLQAHIEFTQNSCNISEFRFLFGQNPIMLKAFISDFTRPQIDAALSAKIDLNTVKDILPLPEGMSLSGRIMADIKTKGLLDPADPSQMDVQGTLALESIETKTKDLLQPLTLNGDISFSFDKITTKLKAHIGSSNLSFHSTLSDYFSMLVPDTTKKYAKPQVTLKLSAPIINTKEFLPPKKEKEADVPAVKDKKTDPKPLLAAPFSLFNMNTTIECGHIIHDNLSLTNAKQTIVAQDALITIMTKAKLFKGALSSTINVNTRDVSNIQSTIQFAFNNIDINELVTQSNNMLSEKQSLNHELKKLDQTIFGTANLTTNLQCNGATSDDMVKNLAGQISAQITNGEIKAGIISKSLGSVTEKFIPLKDISFRSLSTIMTIRQERVYFDSFEITSAETGDWDIDGNVGFDASLAFNIADKLPLSVSNNIISLQNKGKLLLQDKINSVAKGKLQQIASNLVSSTGIPTDKSGRVTILLGMGGTASSPTVTFNGFKKGEGQSSQTTTPQKQVSTMVKEELKKKADELQKMAKEKLAQEKAVLEAAAKKKLNEEALQKLAQEKQLKIDQEKLKKAQEEASKKLGKKFKKLFNE